MGMSGMVDDNSTMIFDGNLSGSLEVSNAFVYMVWMMKKGYSSLAESRSRSLSWIHRSILRHLRLRYMV